MNTKVALETLEEGVEKYLSGNLKRPRACNSRKLETSEAKDRLHWF
jgi:hypothetical protein